MAGLFSTCRSFCGRASIVYDNIVHCTMCCHLLFYEFCFDIPEHSHQVIYIFCQINMFFDSDIALSSGTVLYQKSLYKKANQKLHALSRIAHYMDSEKLEHVMKAFILSQFTYCPLVWMLSERGLNNKINHLHEKALRIAYKDDVSDFKALLEKDNAVTIHVRNIQLLMTEIFKTQHSLNPTFMKEIFIPKNNQYALRNEQPIKLLRPRTTTFGEKSISFLGGKLWHELSL